VEDDTVLMDTLHTKMSNMMEENIYDTLTGNVPDVSSAII